MMFIVKRLDPKKKPERKRMADVETYREYAKGESGDSSIDEAKTVIYFYKHTGIKPIYSSSTIEELDAFFLNKN